MGVCVYNRTRKKMNRESNIDSSDMDSNDAYV